MIRRLGKQGCSVQNCNVCFVRRIRHAFDAKFIRLDVLMCVPARLVVHLSF